MFVAKHALSEGESFICFHLILFIRCVWTSIPSSPTPLVFPPPPPQQPKSTKAQKRIYHPFLPPQQKKTEPHQPHPIPGFPPHLIPPRRLGRYGRVGWGVGGFGKEKGDGRAARWVPLEEVTPKTLKHLLASESIKVGVVCGGWMLLKTAWSIHPPHIRTHAHTRRRTHTYIYIYTNIYTYTYKI